MKFIVNLIQNFSALITVFSAVGLGLPEQSQQLGIESSQLKIILISAVFLTILAYVTRKTISQPEVGRDKKTQVQIFGKKNKQDMP